MKYLHVAKYHITVLAYMESQGVNNTLGGEGPLPIPIRQKFLL